MAGPPRFVIQKHAASSLQVAGHAKVWLEGEKLTGGWTLHRTGRGAKPQWLLIKRRDEEADAEGDPVTTRPESIRSGRTVERIAKDG